MALRNKEQIHPQAQGNDKMEGQDLNSLMRLLYSFHNQENDGVSSATSSQTPACPSQGDSTSSSPVEFGIVDSLTLVNCKKLDLDNVGDESFEDNDADFQLASPSNLLQVRSRTGVRRGEDVIYSVKTKG